MIFYLFQKWPYRVKNIIQWKLQAGVIPLLPLNLTSSNATAPSSGDAASMCKMFHEACEPTLRYTALLDLWECGYVPFMLNKCCPVSLIVLSETTYSTEEEWQSIADLATACRSILEALSREGEHWRIHAHTLVFWEAADPWTETCWAVLGRTKDTLLWEC